MQDECSFAEPQDLSVVLAVVIFPGLPGHRLPAAVAHDEGLPLRSRALGHLEEESRCD